MKELKYIGREGEDLATETCKWCDGTGHDFDTDGKCTQCGGTGKVDI